MSAATGPPPPSSSSSSSSSTPFRLVPIAYGAVGTANDDEENGRISTDNTYHGALLDAGPLATSTRWIVLVFAFLASSLVVLIVLPRRGLEGETIGTTAFETTTDAAEASISDILAAIRAGRVNSSVPSSSSQSSITATTTSTSTATAVSTDPLVITSVGAYGDVKKSILTYPFLETAVFVEPYKAHTLTVTNADPTCDYRWTITGGALPTPLTYTGAAVQATVSGAGLFALAVAEACDAGRTPGRALTSDLWAKYVFLAPYLAPI